MASDRGTMTTLADPSVMPRETDWLNELTTRELRSLIATEREEGRAWGQVAENARKLLALRTGRAS